MKNKLSVLLVLLFLLCTAMCCEEFEEYIPCQVTLLESVYLWLSALPTG